ncbi:MAG: Zn-ribbon domain-containing OB-fold protein [Hyphomicrobiaceae bacterium]|nr:MAG: Zn-ribbon domain-containing OB-fold protein [Hyphomicrobiaceae bacterium]
MSDGTSAPALAAKASDFGRPYWDALRAGRLTMQACSATGRFQHPPRPVSFANGSRTLDWREIGGNGRIYAFTINRRPAPGFEGRTPYIVAVIELPERIRIMANIEARPESVRIGAAVRFARKLSPTGDPLFELDKAVPGTEAR